MKKASASALLCPSVLHGSYDFAVFSEPIDFIGQSHLTCHCQNFKTCGLISLYLTILSPLDKICNIHGRFIKKNPH